MTSPLAATIALTCTLFAVIGAVAIATSLPSSPNAPVYVPVAALGAMTIGVLAVLSRRADAFSPLGLVTIFYITSFVLGPLYFFSAVADTLTPRYDTAWIPGAVWMAAGSYLVFVVGYQFDVLRLVLQPRLHKTVRGGRPNRPAVRVIAGLFAVGWVGRLLSIASGNYFHLASGERTASNSTGWITTAADLPTLATAMMAIWLLRTPKADRSLPLVAAAACSVAIEVVWAIPSGSRSAFLTVAMMLTIVFYYSRGRLPSKVLLLAVAAVAVVVVFPLLAEYRRVQATGVTVGSALAQSARQIGEQSPSEALSAGFETTISRFSSVTSVAAALNAGRTLIGPDGKKTYLWLPAQITPRAVWPGKPDPGKFGNTFGRAYGINGDRDYSTGIPVPHFLEAWFAAGWMGLFPIMLLVGVAFRAIDTVMSNRRTSPEMLATYAWLAWPLVNAQESIIANSTASVMKSAVTAAVLILVLRKVPLTGDLISRKPADDRLISGPRRSPAL